MRWLQGFTVVLTLVVGQTAGGQTPTATPPVPPTFRTAIDRVLVSAVVRDETGKLVTDLVRTDFEVLDDGHPRPITDFRSERAPLSVALLFDFSGSMDVAAKVESARLAARQILAWLQPGRDELAIDPFDTALHQLEPFAPYRKDGTLERLLFGMTPFGMTSLNDAIAAAARDVAARPNSHRALIVLTDGLDNHSQLSPAEASGIASSIDVPVYVVAVVFRSITRARARPSALRARSLSLTSATSRAGPAGSSTSPATRRKRAWPPNSLSMNSAISISSHSSRAAAGAAPARGARQAPSTGGQGAWRLHGRRATNGSVRSSQPLVVRRQLMRLFIVALSVAALAAGSSACATKNFVKERVGQVNDKVESVSKSLEETQERTRKNEAAITEANAKIVTVDEHAAAANTAAAGARTAADTAATKADTVDKSIMRILYQVTLSEDQGNFEFNDAQLPDSAKARIDEVVKQLLANPNGAYIEIAGYTDNIGPRDYNMTLGLERAEAVKRYIYEQYHIPLFRMSVISYGPESPVAPNTTRDGARAEPACRD